MNYLWAFVVGGAICVVGQLLAQGVVKAVDEIGLPGVFTGGIGAAAGGITASLVFALLAALVGKSKDQN